MLFRLLGCLRDVARHFAQRECTSINLIDEIHNGTLLGCVSYEVCSYSILYFRFNALAPAHYSPITKALIHASGLVESQFVESRQGGVANGRAIPRAEVGTTTCFASFASLYDAIIAR